MRTPFRNSVPRACGVSLVGCLAAAGCFSLDRVQGLQAGDIVGRAVHDDEDVAAAYARVVPDGSGFVRVAGADGGFVVRGLSAGTWLLQLDEDQNGDGKAERAGRRAVELREIEGALEAVLLGDVALGGVVDVSGRAHRDGGLSANARAYVVRDTAALTLEELGGVDENALLQPGAERDAVVVVDLGAGGGDGAFSFAGVGPGAFSVVVFDPGDGVDDVPGLSAPALVQARAGGSVDVGTVELVDETRLRRVQLATRLAAPAAVGDAVTVTVVRAGGDRRDGARSDAVIDDDGVALTVPAGVFDLYVDGVVHDFHGVLLDQLVLPPQNDADTLRLGPLLLSGQDPCDPVGDVDRDGDGRRGLPSKLDAPELHARCFATCAVRGAALRDAACDGFDCDDDADGDPDVVEDGCVSVCAGGDRDQDGVCDRGDNAVVDCFPDCDVVVDGGVPDDDAGVVVRGGCDGATALAADGAAAGVIDVDGADDIDACQGRGVADAVFSLPAAGVATLNADLLGSTFDTVLGVYAGDCTAAPTCNDDNGGPTSFVALDDVAADTVFFVVEGYRGDVGDFALHVSGTWRDGGACDPARTSFTCPAGACAFDGAGFRCLPPRDCADGIDADDDGAVDEDAADCAAPPTLSCPASASGDVLFRASVAAAAADDGAIAQQRWTLVDAPLGATVALEDATSDTVSFTPLLAGDYRLRLVVADDDSQLVACEVPFAATTDDVFRVELLWNLDVPSGDPTDLDLHLLHPTATGWFDPAFDCHFANCRADALSWQLGGGVDPSPSLDIDDRDGRGPENINITAPEDITYRIGVHAFADDGAGPAAAFVNVFCFGQLQETLGPVVVGVGGAGDDDNELWKVADVEFAGDSCNVSALGDVVDTAAARAAR